MDPKEECRVARVIVVPRPLAAQFHELLRRRYQDRPDVHVIVDRRHGERRRSTAEAPLECGERRRADRRRDGATWSLPELPMRTAEDPLAAGRWA